MADPAEWLRSSEPRGADLRSRLFQVAGRVREATRQSRGAGFARFSTVIAGCADEIEQLLEASRSPATFVIECAIARAERAVDVWRDLASF